MCRFNVRVVPSMSDTCGLLLCCSVVLCGVVWCSVSGMWQVRGMLCAFTCMHENECERHLTCEMHLRYRFLPTCSKRKARRFCSTSILEVAFFLSLPPSPSLSLFLFLPFFFPSFSPPSLSLHLQLVYTYVYMYVYAYISLHVYVYVYTYAIASTHP